MLKRAGVWLGFSLMAACANATPGGEGGDAGVRSDGGGGGDGATALADAALVQVPPGAGITLCGAGGEAQRGNVRSVTCLAPVDVAVESSVNGTTTWQPGPIYRVSP